MSNPTTKCKFCNKDFNSRNEMFRHLKSSRMCFNLANEGSEDNSRSFLKVEKQKVAIQFGYYTSKGSNRNINEDAADIVCSSFLEAMKYLYPSSLLEYDGNYSLASSVRSRHPVLAQEKECSAFSDVIGINYKCVDIKIDFEEVLKYVQSILQCKKEDMRFWVLNIKNLAVSTKFHAEKNCTQRNYQYLLPVSWIDDDGKDTTDWIKSKIEVDPIASTTQRPQETPSSIMRLKKTLRLLESGDVDEKISKRFGKLANKERKPMHNFCDQSIPMVNPSNEHVWTSIDKARLSGFIIDYSVNDDDNAYIILDFKSDGFLKEQCRRMVATIVAVVRRWLPDDYFDFATDSNYSIETPSAPLHLLYLHSVRYHFLELAIGSNTFEESKSHAKYLSRLQQRSFLHRRKEHQEEAIWLDDLKSEISIRILARLNEIRSTREDQLKQFGQESNRIIDSAKQCQNINASVPLKSTPQIYAKALLLLQKICKQELWPMTHHSKSIVMKSPFIHDLPKAKTVGKKLHGTHYCGHLLQSGSFTLCNPKLSGKSILPMNQHFPELAQAVFELEKYITTDNEFLASSHCTLCRNVEMTPQFLKGEGNRDTCKIVGLGDYHGGEFVVGGEMYDVRYEPLKFNFWQIHYDKPFNGEKFSLIWYTPKFRDKVGGTPDERFEDSLALSLLKNHSESLPTFPMLKFRKNSTDALVISEILDTRSVYALSPQVWQCMNVPDVTLQVKDEPQQLSLGFGVASHDAVLDVGKTCLSNFISMRFTITLIFNVNFPLRCSYRRLL